MEISQRAKVAAAIARLAVGRPSLIMRLRGVTVPGAAKMMHVGERHVAHAKAVLRDRTPEDIASVTSGKKTVGELAGKIKARTRSSP
jgi:hypothetical protein